ncbi:MAG: hypothetical protein CK426_03035, partial [Legionella sp.]
MRTNERIIELNPAGYALEEIDKTLNSIEEQVNQSKGCINIKIKVTGGDPCSCCGLVTCCCTLLCCVICIPCAVGGVVLNILTCGHLGAQNQAQINVIQPDQNEMDAINQLKENLRALPTQRNTLFVPKISAISVVSLIDSTLTSSTI